MDAKAPPVKVGDPKGAIHVSHGGPAGSTDAADLPRARKSAEPTYYHDYLGLDAVLSAQNPKSLSQGGKMAHDEMLFIIIHQTYELWFKQVLHDLDSCRSILNRPSVPERELGVVVHRLSRITKILNILVDQLTVLETMTPLDFLDFRDYLFPASGFQSTQFRLLENALGLRREQRLKYARADYCSALSAEHRDIVTDSEKQPSLFELVESFLERTPFLETKDFNFWAEYEAAVRSMHQRDRDDIKEHFNLTPQEKEVKLQEIDASEANITAIFREDDYNRSRLAGERRLSYKATKAAILISLYRDEPIFQIPHQMMNFLLDVDEMLTMWRQRHAAMVHRMLGLKMGTGGSSGYHYLKATANHHKIFDDFFNLSNYLIPRSMLPRLPEEIVNRLRFHYDESASRDIAEKVQQHINPNVIDPLPSHANTEVHVPSVVSPHSQH